MTRNKAAASQSYEARPMPRAPGPWDFLAFGFLFGLAAVIGLTLRQTGQPVASVEHPLASLDPGRLPVYALRTTLRMLAALALSFFFSLGYATLAAKSRRAAMVLIPILDVLQSVPILGYISFTVTFFMSVFPGEVLGAELACVFAIFTGQVWNMTLSLYQALRTVPADLTEVARGMHLTGWQKFMRLELPFAMPGLVWNMMMSMSGGWFFIVAAEAIKVGDLQISLPGIGSYLALAIERRDLGAVGWTIAAMALVILLYDQLLFRPLVAWADKFRFETTAARVAPRSWFFDLLRRARLLNRAVNRIASVGRKPLRLRPLGRPVAHVSLASRLLASRATDWVWSLLVLACGLYGAAVLCRFMQTELKLSDLRQVALLGAITLARVATVVTVASVIWVPLGVAIGLRPRLAELLQPVAQFLAAFPANLFFPVAVIGILHFRLNPDTWLTPLILLGTQWYVLFNVIAGTVAFPNDMREAARNFDISGLLWWRRVMLPGIMPYYITGALTATGAAWNTTIVAEAVSWGDNKVVAHGLGSYIAGMTDAADFPRIVLGIAVMSGYVILFNRLLWRPLYAWSERRFRLG